ncbi:MAG TPA: PAS domain S-box protein [Gemmatimonadales bacterium]|nr:PAS domain S-box protein [Gemmatimonadales bacterium]
MPWRVWNWSIERKLPLLFTGLLAIVVAGFTWAAYRQVRGSAVSGANERLQRVTSQLVDLLGASVRQLVTNARGVAESPAVRSYLRAPFAGVRADALTALQPPPATTQMVVATELWDANGTRALTTRADLPPLPRETAQSLLRSLDTTATPTIGAIRHLGGSDTLVYPVIAPVRDRGELLGYVVRLRRISGSSQGGRQLAQLIGSDAALYFGNADGDLWTDFSAVVPGPPVDVGDAHGLIEYRREGGARYLAAPARIPATPWMVLVEFPRAPVLAPAHTFLLRMGTVGLLLVVTGAAATWGLSRRMRALQAQVAARTHELQESETRLRGVTETAYDAIIAASAEGNITYWNPGAARMFGYAPNEVLGQPLTMLMPERYRDPHRQGIARYVATRDARVVGRTVELEGRRKDGREFPLELSLATADTPAGIAFTGIIRDITERKRIEAALRETNAELESFSYSVSHDLRAPLRAIHGFARILIEDHRAQLDPEAQRLLGVIDDNTKRMGQLIDDLLAFSRLGRKELDTTRVDMTELVRGIADGLRRAEEDRALEVAVDRLPPARGDRDLLRQAITNLLQNAVKFTRRRPAARIEVGTRADGGETVYFVKDNGAGFDQRYAGKLFGVFQRLHRLDEFEGTGVGLAIVQRIIHRHGGRVWAEGRVDEGATFYFTLPGAPGA